MQTHIDTWIQDPSAHLILQMNDFAKNDIRLLEAVVLAAEIDSIKHKDSPHVHYFLTKLYQDLPEELSYEFRERLEIEKLREEGKEHILEMPRDSETIIANMGPNPTATQGVLAASDYLHRINIERYRSQGNIERAVWQFYQAVSKSEKNPAPYKELFSTTAASMMLDERVPVGNLQFIAMFMPKSYLKK